MTVRLAALALVLAAPVLAAEVRLGRPVMGTVLQLTVVDGDAQRATRVAEAALREAERWDDVLTTWRADGELARLAAAAGQGPQRLSPRLEQALRTMGELHRATGGTFDPAVGPLVRWWRRAADERRGEAPAGPFRWELAIVLGDGTASLAAGAALDAGGIGKGIALDAMGELLRAEGVRAAFLDFGRSSLLALGAPPEDSRGWLVQVAGASRGSSHGFLYLRDASLSTSRTVDVGDEAGSIIDPRTGHPITRSRIATVISRSAATAEAWTKALVILGRDGLDRVDRASCAGMVEDDTGFAASPGFVGQLRPR